MICNVTEISLKYNLRHNVFLGGSNISHKTQILLLPALLPQIRNTGSHWLCDLRRKAAVCDWLSLGFDIFLKNYLILVALGLRCCTWAFCSWGEWDLLFIAVHGLLIVVAFLVHCSDLSCCGGHVPGRGLQSLQRAGSVAGLCGLNCSTTCGIFPDQGLNSCTEHLLW